MDCTKAEISKLIQWSTSRYNSMKKTDVINDIIFRIEKGEDCTAEYRSGCYSEKAHDFKIKCKWSGGNYTLVIKDGVNILKNCVSDVKGDQNEEVIINKPKTNKFFIPASKIRVEGNPINTKYWYMNNFDVIGKEYDVLDQTIDCFKIEHNGFKGHIRKIDSKIIEGGSTERNKGISLNITQAKQKAAIQENKKSIRTSNKSKERVL